MASKRLIMHLPIADFPITTERDFNWTAQRARLLGTLASLRPKARNDFSKSVAEAARTIIPKPFRGNIQFAIGYNEQQQFIEATIIGQQTDASLTDVDEPTLQKLVDEVEVDLSGAESSTITLRKWLPGDSAKLGPEDVTEWGTMLATRTTEGALVQAQYRLREVLASSGLTSTNSRDAQVHELLALVASTTDNSVVVMDASGQVEWVNDSFTRITGYELNEVQGKLFSELMIGPETESSSARELQSAIKLGHGVSKDVLRYRKDGKTYWELLSLTPVFDKSGAASRWVSIGADISARHAAEEALTQAKATAEAASNAKSDFLANMSHEIRTPMNAVLGMTDLALGTQLSPEQHEYLSIVKESAQALMSLLNDILDLSKIEAGRLTVDPVPFDLARLVENTLKPFAKQAQCKGLQFQHSIRQDTPAHLVGDATRVRQILVNLVSNAVKFTSLGSIDVTIESQWEADDDVSLHLAVSDSGIGMSKETLQRIFDAFTQADSSITREYGGTGLGLTITARLVELMEGRIWVQSHEGKGSTFHVSLPFQKTDAYTVKSNSTSNEFDLSPSAGQPCRSLKILVADDNQANRALAKKILDKRGHRVAVVSNGSEALDYYRAHELDAAILDIQMPELDGFSITAAIRREESAQQTHLPLIAMTAHAMPGDRERCLHAGMDAYLSKPINARELYTLVESLGRAQTEAIQRVENLEEPSGHPFAVALARLEGDEELLREQMQFFLDESPDLMERVLAALDEQNQEEVRIAAHRLKGLASTVDGGELCLIANRIEQASAVGSLDEVTAIIDELASALTRLTDTVGDYVAS